MKEKRCGHGCKFVDLCTICTPIVKPTDQEEADPPIDKSGICRHRIDTAVRPCHLCTREERDRAMVSALCTQVGGDHYKDRKIQPVQYIEANQLGFLEGCVVKRVSRHNMPTGKGKQDIEKAIHELQLLLELRYGN